MIPRYTRPEMAAIWEPQTRFRIWFEIEAHATDALAELGVVPKEAAKAIWAKGKAATFDIARIDETEREVKHDVIAFLTHLAEIVGPEALFVHQGMTSSDVLDTCFNVQLVRAADLLIADIDKVLAALKRRALEYKMTPVVGRSHGIHAEPTTFGLKLAYAYAEFARGRERLLAARREVATCAISGAVGTFAQIAPAVEAHVAKAMGLAVEPISTQVIPRDRHAMYFATLAVIAASMERLATEIRHLQRTEVLEAEEYFSPGQKGSSAMPHKRNPVLSENLTGLARMVRAYVTPALENVVLSQGLAARGRLPPGPAQRHEGVGGGRRFPEPAGGRSGRAEISVGSRDRGEFRPRISPQGGRYDLCAGVRDPLGFLRSRIKSCSMLAFLKGAFTHAKHPVPEHHLAA